MQDSTNTATIKDIVANLKDSLFEFGTLDNKGHTTKGVYAMDYSTDVTGKTPEEMLEN